MKTKPLIKAHAVLTLTWLTLTVTMFVIYKLYKVGFNIDLLDLIHVNSNLGIVGAIIALIYIVSSISLLNCCTWNKAIRASDVMLIIILFLGGMIGTTMMGAALYENRTRYRRLANNKEAVESVGEILKLEDKIRKLKKKILSIKEN